MGLLFLWVGLVLFLWAKISVLKKGKWITFGDSAAREMSRPMARTYYLGYVWMIVGVVI